jgi:hypothetical protein
LRTKFIKISKIWEQKSRNKNSKKLRTKVKKNPGTKSKNENFKILGTKI